MAVVNLAALSCAFGAGWRSSTLKGEQLHPPRTGGTSYDAAAALEDARTVLAINCRALFWIVLLGMFSAGAYGLLLLGVNGYGIGYALAALYPVLHRPRSGMRCPMRPWSSPRSWRPTARRR